MTTAVMSRSGVRGYHDGNGLFLRLVLRRLELGNSGDTFSLLSNGYRTLGREPMKNPSARSASPTLPSRSLASGMIPPEKSMSLDAEKNQRVCLKLVGNVTHFTEIGRNSSEEQRKRERREEKKKKGFSSHLRISENWVSQFFFFVFFFSCGERKEKERFGNAVSRIQI